MTIQSVLLLWNDPATGDPQEQWVNLPATIGRGTDNALVLRSDAISRKHTALSYDDNQLMVRDEGSTNGTYLSGQRISHTLINPGDTIYLGPFLVTLAETSTIIRGKTVVPIALDEQDRQTVQVTEQDLQSFLDLPATAILEASPPDREVATIKMDDDDVDAILSIGDAFTDRDSSIIYLDRIEKAPQQFPTIMEQDVVSVADLTTQNELSVDEITYLSLGAGVGSFCWIDYLRIAGVPADAICTIGFETRPFARYRRLCEHSQIPNHERLRSDSGSTPDNIWGFPGYAMREIATDTRQGNITHALELGWKIISEPILSDSYTPIAGRVYDSVDREAERIGWDQMVIGGRIRALRKTDDGRYVVYYDRLEDHQPRLMVAQFVHLALGYPGFQLLPDLTAYREQTGDFLTIVNAYEPHDHVYEALGKKGGVLLLRGRGIVASRLIQRVYEVRQKYPEQDIKIVHLLRSPLPQGHRYGGNQRLVENHWELQPYNWPKAAFGGDLKSLLENALPDQRDQLLNDWGGTTTADRKDWRDIISTGLAEGWYEIRFGAVSEVRQGAQGKIETIVKTRADQKLGSIVSDFVIDATGLNAKLDYNPLLKDLLNTYDIPRNIKGRIQTDNTFQILSMKNGNGRLFAVGAMTFGNDYAPVDSFVGLQYAAGRTLETLQAVQAPHLKSLTPLRSIAQYFKWIRGRQP